MNCGICGGWDLNCVTCLTLKKYSPSVSENILVSTNHGPQKNIKMKYSNGTTRNIESDYRYFNESILN